MIKLKNKIYLLLLFLIFPLFLWGCGPKPKTEEKNQPSPSPEVYQQLALEEKPFLSLVPRADGRELTLTISHVQGYDAVEYEIVYFSGEKQLGLVGELDLKGRSFATKTGLTLGSCSKGVCKYDENVNGGNVTLRFRGVKPAKIKSSFVLETIPAAGGQISSLDKKITLSFSSGGYYVILMDTQGLPGAKPEGELIAGPYAVFSPATVAVYTVLFSNPGKTFIWNTKKETWEELSGKVSLPTTFVLVK